MSSAVHPATTKLWWIALSAAALLGLTMGTRFSMGLFLSPMNTTTGAGMAALGLGVALSQLGWGAAQPVAGWFAARHGVARVIAVGAVLSALATAALPFMHSVGGIVMAMTLVGMAGAAAGSAPMLMAAVAERVHPARRGLATGIVSAGGSAGQLLIAPTAQATIVAGGWAFAMFGMAALALLAWPLSRVLSERHRTSAGTAPTEEAVQGVRDPAQPPDAAVTPSPRPAAPVAPAQDWRRALRDPRYWLLTAGFSVCGFHVSFLTTHMPGVIESCGMPATLAGIWLAIVGLCNIAGSVVSGMLGQRLDMARMLMVLYAGRALGIGVFLWAPKTEAVMLGFAVWMGVTYMATLPPTAGLTARLYGAHNLGVLLGIIMFVHQIGAFLGAWLGGVAVAGSGHYDLVWVADLTLAVLAVGLHAPLQRRRRAAATVPVGVQAQVS